jgi:16S rRNA (cytosine1407-C5)-methyltransferase
MKQIFHPNFIARYSPLFSKEEFELFLEYCQKPLRKAIRVNTSKISLDDFCLRAEKNNWGLEKILYLENAYFINRDDTSVPLGKSIEYFA